MVIITDKKKQDATSKDADAVLATIDQTVTTESAAANASALTKGWDGQQLQKEVDAQVAITKEFSKQAPKAIADYAQSQIKALEKSGASAEEIAKWGEGGVYRVALHAVSGALSGGLGGALGSTTVAGSAKYLDKLQSMTMAALLEQGLSPGAAKMFAEGLAEATSLAIGTSVGGMGGGAAALGTDTNNRQLHPQEASFIKSKADAYAKLKGITAEQAEQELTRGALYANDADWQKAYATYTPEEVEKLKTAAVYLQDQAKTSGLTFTTTEGTQQAAFTSNSAQFNNSKYLATQAFSDAQTRDLYATQAAISLQEMGMVGGAKFGINAAQGFGAGIPAGAIESLKSYSSLLDPATYSKLADSVKAMMDDPSGTMKKLTSSLQGHTQDAVIGIYIDLLQKDSAAFGESAGKIFGSVLVEVALAGVTAGGAKAVGIAAESGEQVYKVLTAKIAAWNEKRAVDALNAAASKKVANVTVPIDFDNHILNAEIKADGRVVGGHSVASGEVRIIPGSESAPNAQGVYVAKIEVADPANPGAFLSKTNNNGESTMFPKTWTSDRIKVEVDEAFKNKTVVGNKWTGKTPSGVVVEGFLSPKTTVYPKI